MGKRRLVRLPFGLIGAGIITVVFTTAAIWMSVVDDPHGGEPTATISLDHAVQGVTQHDIGVVGIEPGVMDDLGPSLRAPEKPDPLGPRYASDALEEGTRSNEAVKGLSTKPDQRISETSAHGLLPKVDDTSLRPLDVYARPAENAFSSSPKIAVVVGGVGLNTAWAQTAVDRLPVDVTLAMAPYGTSLELLMQRARSKGHELLLQVPLEPFDFPDNDPGPHTLLVSLPEDEMLDRLNWLMARTTNYVGLINTMGARFTSTGSSLQLFLEELKMRGLMFADNGGSSRSIAAEVAKEVQTPFSGTDVVLDDVPRADAIDAKLLQLEAIARERGVAVASASALPVTIARIEEWARDLEERGLQLVPVSATIDRQDPVR
ncbi:divergent polysaccharide deacetylase family protein [Roseibium sp. RKSG952]|nr:divergent polysaccharide deacetylase family protein [Roseibium sp. RKSG952]